MTTWVNPTKRIGGVDQIVVPERAVTAMDDAPYDDEQYVRIDFLGPTNPFASCDKQEVMDHKQFKVPVTRNDEPSVIATCTLIPKPCDWFFVEVNKFSDRTKSTNCPYTSGQIEIEPW